jgi:Raf kinase inhibitor-like YbhB/YbcL family protein
MKIWSHSFQDNARIPAKYAFCLMDAKTHVALSENCNPHLAWSDLPAGTQSLALICHDYDVPSKGDDVNQEGKTISANLPRVDFYHWLLIDLPPTLSSIAEGEFSSQVTPRGKPGPGTLHQARHGINDYTPWFAADKDMSGNYYGYDGPCPPWNDTIPHHYVFTLYALNVKKLPIGDPFTGTDLMPVIKAHTLAKASITGVYTLNPVLDKTL